MIVVLVLIVAGLAVGLASGQTGPIVLSSPACVTVPALSAVVVEQEAKE